MPLGIFRDVNFEERQIALLPGDKVVFFTDGVIDAMNPQRQRFGYEKFYRILHEGCHLNARKLLSRVRSRLERFTREEPPRTILSSSAWRSCQSLGWKRSKTGEVGPNGRLFMVYGELGERDYERHR